MGVINGFNDTFGKFQTTYNDVKKSLDDLNTKYNTVVKTVKKLDETHIAVPSPARKIQRNYTTPPRAKVATKQSMHSTELFDTYEEFDNEDHLNLSSDAEMNGDADEN